MMRERMPRQPAANEMTPASGALRTAVNDQVFEDLLVTA